MVRLCEVEGVTSHVCVKDTGLHVGPNDLLFLVQFTVAFFGSTSDTLTETIMAVEQLFLVVDAVPIISYYVVSSVAQWHLFMSSRLVKTFYSRFALVNNSQEMPGVLLCPHIWLLGGSPHFCWWNSHISSCKFPWFGGQILQLRCSKSEFLLQKSSPSWLIKQVSLKPCSNPWFFPPKNQFSLVKCHHFCPRFSQATRSPRTCRTKGRSPRFPGGPAQRPRDSGQTTMGFKHICLCTFIPG